MTSAAPHQNRKNILYLTRNGLLEPLGQSQILPYLRQLSNTYQITIVSFEKPADLCNQLLVTSVRETCRQYGLIWAPFRFRSKPRLIAPLFAFFQLLFAALYYSKGARKPSFVHARSYIPVFVALIVKCLTQIPFLFDMRALWPEELISGSHIRRESLLYNLILRLEHLSLSNASGVVSLTNAAATYLKDKYPDILHQRIVVIPTCADLQAFQYSTDPPVLPITVGCIGTLLSSWFMTDWLSAFFESFNRVEPTARFEIISRDPPHLIHNALGLSKQLNHKISISSAEPHEMPSVIQRHSFSVMFFTPGLSKLGSCPTRMAEVLGSGRPVVTNYGIGDLDQIVLSNQIGVLARDCNIQDMDKTALEVLSLLKDTHLPNRCRRTAENLFSLQAGTESYRRLYSAIVSQPQLN